MVSCDALGETKTHGLSNRLYQHGINQFMCPNITSFPAEGAFSYEGIFEYVKFRITKCSNTDLEDMPSDLDSDGRPLNECFPEQKTQINLLLMDSNVDLAQPDPE